MWLGVCYGSHKLGKALKITACEQVHLKQCQLAHQRFLSLFMQNIAAFNIAQLCPNDGSMVLVYESVCVNS